MSGRSERPSSARKPFLLRRGEGESVWSLGGRFTIVFAPSGIAHTLTVDVEPTRFLVFASPAGLERVALELGQPANSDNPPAGPAVRGPDVLGPVADKYGIELVGAPHRALGG